MSNRNLCTFIFGSMVGVLIETYFFVPVTFVLFCFLSILLFIILNLISKKIPEYILIFVLLVTAILFGVLLYKNDNSHKAVSYDFGDTVQLEGAVMDDPIIKNTGVTFTLRSNNKYFLVRAIDSVTVSYGDNVRVLGLLEEPKNFMTDQGKEFDYVSYLSVKNIYALISDAKIIDVYENAGNPIKKALISVKNSVENMYSRIFSPKDSGLLSGIMLGSKEGISQDLRNEFIRTGTIHIVALSGYNVTIVAEGIMKLLGVFLTRSVATLGGILGILLFVVMTGLQTSAIRAGIMATLLLFARAIGRPYVASRMLFITGFIMVLINPQILAHDVSFQLSFLATLGIIYIDPILKPKLIWLKNNFLISTLSATLSAQIAVFPFILYTMGTLSLISPVVNILILPIIPIVMFLSLGIYILGIVFVQLSIPFAFILHLLLSYIFQVVHLGSILEFSSFTFPHVSVVFTLILYSVIGFWLYKSHRTLSYSAIL